MYKKNGFTLLELLVVVLIIGVLTAIAVPQYQYTVYKARYLQMVVLVDSIVRAQENHFLATGEYTMDLDALDITLPSGETSGTASRRNYKNYSIYILGDIHQVAIGHMQTGASDWDLNYYHYYKRIDTGAKWRPECRCSPEGPTHESCRVCAKVGAVYGSSNASYSIYYFY